MKIAEADELFEMRHVCSGVQTIQWILCAVTCELLIIETTVAYELLIRTL